MSYHRFSNLREIYQGNLNGKIMRGVKSRDFEDLKCNCSEATKINGECIYKGKCRCSMVVYQATCRQSNKIYIGNTQQKLKKRIDQHLDDVCHLTNKGAASDSFAKHFAAKCDLEKTLREGTSVNYLP